MERSEPASTFSGTFSIPFVLGVLAICFVVFGVIAQLAAPSSSSPVETSLTSVELRALAQQATLRVSASACGRVIQGSGVIIDGQLVTNAHIVEGATDVKADQPIDPVVLPVVAVNVGSDLAAAGRPVGVSLVLARLSSVTADSVAGQNVTVAGHADGGVIEIQSGVISARVPGGAYGYSSDVLLINVETRGGYSGGPVLDDAGNVVAILSGFDRTTGLSLAIPADVVAQFLDDAQASAVLAGSEASDNEPKSDCGAR